MVRYHNTYIIRMYVRYYGVVPVDVDGNAVSLVAFTYCTEGCPPGCHRIKLLTNIRFVCSPRFFQVGK